MRERWAAFQHVTDVQRVWAAPHKLLFLRTGGPGMCSQQLRKMADSAFPRVASGSEPEITDSYFAIDTWFTWLIFTHIYSCLPPRACQQQLAGWRRRRGETGGLWGCRERVLGAV